MFQLSKEEFDELKKNLIFQFGISRWGGTRKLPHAFTEQGVAMLSGILNSSIALVISHLSHSASPDPSRRGLLMFIESFIIN